MGHEVAGIDRIPPETTAPMERFARGNIRDSDALRRALQGCGHMLSLAAAHHDFGIERHTYSTENETAA